MSKEQQPPSIMFKGPSLDEGASSTSVQSNVASKVYIGRSHSAPQAQNQFTAMRMGLKNKGSPSSPKKQVYSGIPTLSDGVIHVSQEQVAQVAADVLSNHNQTLVSPTAEDSSIQMSPTPLCDSNHSPSSAKRYQQASPMFGQEPKPDDVWQRRERFLLSHHKEDVELPENIHQDSNSSGNSVFSSIKSQEQRTAVRQQGIADSGAGNISHQVFHSTHSVSNGATSSFERQKQSQDQSEIMLTEKSSLTNIRSVASNGNADTTDALQSKSLVQNCEATEINGEVNERKAPRRPLRQAQSEIILPSTVHRKVSMDNVKEKGYAKLEEELLKAQRALELKDEEVDELRGIRERLMKEVSDFTASLFEEVNSQLNEAALSEQHAKKQLQEANTKIEVLTAEVAALKDLVLTSTPSSPNKHLHPQIDTQASKKEKGSKPFWKGHRRSTSHHQFTKESREKAEANQHHSQLKEMDTNAFDEFSRWLLQPHMDFTCQFLARVQYEDIQPCLNFKNVRLSEKLHEGVKQNSLTIEPIPGDHSFPRKCSLSETHKLCNYKIKFEGDDEWYSVSQMSRNRIAAVCDFYAYIRYIIQGLVKSSDKDIFVEMVRLRNQMAQARLGLL